MRYLLLSVCLLAALVLTATGEASARENWNPDGGKSITAHGHGGGWGRRGGGGHGWGHSGGWGRGSGCW